MLGIDRQAARATWTVLLIALAIFLIWLARETILLFTLALFFAYMMSPIVNMVQRFAPKRMSRNLSLTLVYILLVAAIAGTTAMIGSAVAQEAATLTEELPKLVQNKDLLASLPFPAALDPLKDKIIAALRPELAHLDQTLLPILKNVATGILTHAGSILLAVLIPILSFFFLKDGAAIRDAVIATTTEGIESIVLDEILGDIHALLGHYIRALVILSVATFVSYTLFLSVTGGSYSILLGGTAAALEFVPVVGPLAAAAVIVVVEGFAGYPHLLWIVVFVAVWRMFQDYVLSPYLMSSGIELHPLLVLFGVLAGEQIAGIPGMFFSVPVIAALRVVYVRLDRSRIARDFARRHNQ